MWVRRPEARLGCSAPYRRGDMLGGFCRHRTTVVLNHSGSVVLKQNHFTPYVCIKGVSRCERRCYLSLTPSRGPRGCPRQARAWPRPLRPTPRVTVNTTYPVWTLVSSSIHWGTLPSEAFRGPRGVWAAPTQGLCPGRACSAHSLTSMKVSHRRHWVWVKISKVSCREGAMA